MEPVRPRPARPSTVPPQVGPKMMAPKAKTLPVPPTRCTAKAPEPSVPSRPTPSAVPEPLTPTRTNDSKFKQQAGTALTPPRPARTEASRVHEAEGSDKPKTLRSVDFLQGLQGGSTKSQSTVPEPPWRIPVMAHPRHAVKSQVCYKVLLTDLPVGVTEAHVVRQLEEAGLEMPFELQVCTQTLTCVLYYPLHAESLPSIAQKDLPFEHAGLQYTLPSALVGKVEFMWTEPRSQKGKPAKPTREDAGKSHGGHCGPASTKTAGSTTGPRRPSLEDEAEVDSQSGQSCSLSGYSTQSLVDAWVQRVGSEELPSVGSTWHYNQTCTPCRFLHSGCRRGKTCDFCHLCDGMRKRKRFEAEEAEEAVDMDGSTEAGESLSTDSSKADSVEINSVAEFEDQDLQASQPSHEDMVELIGRLWSSAPPSLKPGKTRRTTKKKTKTSPATRLRRFLKFHGKLWPGSRGRPDTRTEMTETAYSQRPNEPAEPPPSLYRGWRLECEIPVRELRYSQRTCGSHFRCGRRCEDLVRDLHAQKVDARTSNFLVLDVIRKRDRRGRNVLWSLDNRRLWALKKFQQYAQGEVKCRVRFQGDFEALKRFERNFDTDCDGRHIRYRQDSHKWLRARAPVGAPASKRRRTGRR